MGQSSSRRKACDHCVKAKRRCDGRKPCATCTRKSLSCSLLAVCKTSPKYADTEVSHYAADCGIEPDDSTNSWSFPTESGGEDAFADHVYDTPLEKYVLPPYTLVQLTPFRLQKCIQGLQGCVASIAQEGCTLFLKTGFDDSDAKTNTFLACTAYQSRTKHNQAILNNALTRGFIALVRSLQRRPPFREHLSTLQSVVIFQIMFYFGDNEELRSLAENHAEAVQRSVWHFQQSFISEVVFPSTTVDGDNAQHTSYERWFLLESARRTILAHLFVKSAYGQVQNGYSDLVPSLAVLPLSIEGDLWEANTEEAWRSALQKRPRALNSSVITYGEATAFWLSNDCPNMDDFHHLIYGACHDLSPARAESPATQNRSFPSLPYHSDLIL